MRKAFRPVAVVTVALLVASGCAFPSATSVKQDPGASQQADLALARLKIAPGNPGPNGEPGSKPSGAGEDTRLRQQGQTPRWRLMRWDRRASVA